MITKFITILSTLAFMLPGTLQAKNDGAVFTSFTYKGEDAIYEKTPIKSDEMYSPLLQGCYPDPSICRKGNDYYLVCSSFAMFPGVPIFHSTDLVNWKQIGHVLDRVSQLGIQNCGISAGVYAPQIIYNKNNDTFYMITTEISDGFGNIVVKTKDPMKGWSDPYRLNFDGIDPSLFFDEDGKAYVVHNDAPDPGKELYSGHRVIKLWQYDVEKDQIIPGTSKIIVNGGVDITKKPNWIEAPHIYKKNGWYYLMCAEGGTGENHSEVIFRSKNVYGPYIPAGNNPILSQRHLPSQRVNKIDWTGHADLVEGPDGKYYGVFLGIRPNEKGQVATGRETFMLPVDWTGDFPVFENGLIPLEIKGKTPAGAENKRSGNAVANGGDSQYFPSGNWTFTDNFAQWPLDYRWISVRGPREDFIAPMKNGGLIIKPSANKITDAKPVSALFHRQQHIAYTAETTLSFLPKSESEQAGMCLYQAEKYNYAYVITQKGKQTVLQIIKTEAKGGSANTGDVNTNKAESTVVAEAPVNAKLPVSLRIVARGDSLSFYYLDKRDKKDTTSEYKQLGGMLSGSILTTDVAGGFTGNLIGLYATK